MGMYDNPGPNRQSGIITRIIFGLAIMGFGLFTYMNQVEENPLTGIRQHVAISPDKEIQLGLESAPMMSRQMGGEVPASDPRAQVVQGVGNYLVQQTVAKKSPWKFQFHLLSDAQTVNAFALPGGQIFITLGLLNQLQNEAELASVLGHEMGHVIERHTAEQMAKNQLGQMLVVGVGTAASGNDSQNAYMLASFVNQMIQLRYGRQDESEADTWGIRLVTEAGFNPKAMIKVMEVLKAQGGGGSLEIFQTHPNPDLRIEQIKDYLSKHPSPPNLTDGPTLKELYRNPAMISSKR